MELTEDETVQKYAKQYMQNTLLPYEYGWTGIACGFNVIKRKKEHTKSHRKKTPPIG